MSRAGNYLLSLIPQGVSGKQFFKSRTLSASDVSTLSLATREDGYGYAYNAVVSFLAALSALNRRYGGWAITEMYYSAFYIARASLCRQGRIIFHVPKEHGDGYTQFELKNSAGEVPFIPKIPSTHKLVATRFREAGYPHFMSSLEVDGNDPMDWLMEQREAWQYRAPRFCDPDFPDILKQFDEQKPQKLLSAYDNDSSGIYLADPQHAVVAIPFRLITWYVSTSPLAAAGTFQSEDLAFLRRSCMSGKNPLTAISRYIT